MKPTFTAACAALVGLLALSQSAVAQQKTAKQCNDEWSADRAAIQASGKTKRVFVAECRGVPVAARVAAAVPAGKDQYATEAEAKTNCRADTVVWVNSKSITAAAAGVTARPRRARICARRNRPLPASALPGLREARQPDFPRR
jgi:hypothetical protein